MSAATGASNFVVPNASGFYSLNARTNTYGAQVALKPLFSMRWTDNNNLCVILRVTLNVVTLVAANTAGVTERELVIARNFVNSDTGGTALLMAPTPLPASGGGGYNKRASSMPNSLFAAGDIRIGTGIANVGDRGLDANPVASVMGWADLNMTGITIGAGGGAAATGAVWASVGGGDRAKLFEALTSQEAPLILQKNEGIIVRVGKDAGPAGSTQQTYVTVDWAEAPSL